MQELFSEMCSGLTRKTDFEKWPDSIFFFKGDQWMFEYELNSGRFWCNYEKIWKVLEDENNSDFYKVQSFIKDQVEQHFKNKGVTPIELQLSHPKWVEQHFKNKVVTPSRNIYYLFRTVEQHLKNK